MVDELIGNLIQIALAIGILYVGYRIDSNKELSMQIKKKLRFWR